MLEKIIYRNHLGEEVRFGENGVYANENDLRNFTWGVVSRNDKITSFKKGISKKSLQCMIICHDENKGAEIRNRIFEIMEKDVLAGKYGKMIVGDYYLRCYVTESKKKDYIRDKRYMIVDFIVQTDLPAWIKENANVFGADSESAAGFLDFEYDFPYDFKNSLLNGIVTNAGFVESNFRMIIYGKVSNPTLYIGGHEYSVNVDVEEGEYLTIDSVEKTVILTRNDGEAVNCFNLRNKDSYIFQKISAGDNAITSSNSQIYFDIIILDERSEPKWT